VMINMGYGSLLADKAEIIMCFLVVAFLFVVNAFEGKKPVENLVHGMNAPLRWSIYYCFVMAIILLGNFSSKTEFIYFQF
jgi:hypothetical protein